MARGSDLAVCGGRVVMLFALLSLFVWISSMFLMVFTYRFVFSVYFVEETNGKNQRKAALMAAEHTRLRFLVLHESLFHSRSPRSLLSLLSSLLLVIF